MSLNISGRAISLTGGYFHHKEAKTTHGLLRGSQRFDLVGIVDKDIDAKDAGEALNGKPMGIPIYENISDFLNQGGRAEYCIIGVATEGGILPDSLRNDLILAMQSGMSVVNGLHHFLAEDEELSRLADQHGVHLHDIRKPRPRKELSFWSGEIFKVKQPRIAVIGTDCAIGKRTTSKLITHALKDEGYKAEMIYTGQTGWMEGWRYGFILDTIVNDFVSGELESAIVKCSSEADPDIMIIEGQSALRNYSGPCGAELLLSGNVSGVILQYAPARKYFEGWDSLGLEIPSLESEIALIKMYGKEVIGVTLNTEHLSLDEAVHWKNHYTKELNIPVSLPLEEGIGEILNPIRSLIK